MPGTVRFRDVEVDLDSFQIVRAGESVHVEPQVFEVLRYLIEHPDRVVTKTELLDEVWGSRFVSESALSSRIKSARRAIGDDGRRQDLIATVHGRGYRFIAEVTAHLKERSASIDPPAHVPRPVFDVPSRLLERRAEIGILQQAWEDASRGLGRVVVVRGEAGLGKTAFVGSFLDGLCEGGARVLLAGCAPLRTPAVLTAAASLLDQLGVERDVTNGIGSPGDTADRLVGEIRRHVEPTAIALEDVHWADDATLDVIALLARQAPHTPMLVIVTSRAVEIGDGNPVGAIMADLRAQGARFIELEPLSQAGVMELAGDVAAEIPDLHRRTGGNPLLVTQVLASPSTVVPGGVRDLVASHLARMGPGARRSVEALAMSPVPLELTAASAYLGGSLTELAEAERGGLVETSPSHVWFRHELLREAVHDSVPLFSRLELHRRLLASLPAFAPDDRRLHHAVEGLVLETMVALGPGAARRAAELESHREAGGLYEKILRHGDAFEPETLAALMAEYAYELYMLWDLQQAARVARDAATQWRRLGNRSEEGSALTTLARVQVWDDPPVAIATAHSAIALLELDGESLELARARCELAGLYVRNEEYEAGAREAEVGLGLARRVGDRALEALALNYVGCSGQVVGTGNWEAQLRSAIELGAGTKPREYALRSVANLTLGLWDTGRWLEAAQVVDDADDLIAGVEYQTGVVSVKLQAAHVAATLGEPQAALEMVEWIRASGQPSEFEFECDVLEARILMRLNRPGGAERVQELWEAVADQSPEAFSYPTVLLHAAVAELAWRLNDRDMAGDVLVSFGAAPSAAWATELGEVVMYLFLSGLEFEPVGDLLEPFATAVRGDLADAAEAFEHRGRLHDAAACRAAAS